MVTLEVEDGEEIEDTVVSTNKKVSVFRVT